MVSFKTAKNHFLLLNIKGGENLVQSTVIKEIHLRDSGSISEKLLSFKITNILKLSSGRI